MAKKAILVEAKDLKVGDVIASIMINGPLHRKIVLVRHNPGSTRYAFNLEDNDYFTLEEGDHADVIIEE
jgi:hypothetical protein